VIYRKCGKKNCACARAGHPGTAQHLWNTTIKGKSYAKSVKVGPELKKYVEEIDNHRTFVKLCEQLVEVNERICDLRPVPEVKMIRSWRILKKNYTSSLWEIQTEVERIVTSYCKQKTARAEWIWNPMKWIFAMACTRLAVGCWRV